MSRNLTRRDFGKIALAALPASHLPAKTNSKFGGVQIGINAPYSFHGAYNSGDQCLDAIVSEHAKAAPNPAMTWPSCSRTP